MSEYGVDDVDAWAKEQLRIMNKEEAASDHKVLIPLSTDRIVDTDVRLSFNAGYLFLQQIYYQLGLPSICRKIKKENSFEYDLDNILSRLVYGRILFPSSKLSCFEQSEKLIEEPQFDLHQVYRSLTTLSENSDMIQAELYKRSKKLVKRNTGVLFYDCTNYFFEMEHEGGLKQYGPSKEHRPNPIVQMGLFMDKSGIPLAFCINPGNQNEQLSLKPLEQQIMRDFELSKFIVCTEAGLSSDASRKFNNYGERSIITTQSIKKLKSELKDSRYDGFYAVCTNLDDDTADIAKINHDRWEIEESFRIMKSEFEARPVYLQRDGRIEAHFLTCFIALMIYRILEKKLGDSYTCEEIIKTLREMDMRKVGEHGYIPSYTRTQLTDSLHENAGFRTDYELITPKSMAGIIRRTKGL
jgi:hypothetical protein